MTDKAKVFLKKMFGNTTRYALPSDNFDGMEKFEYNAPVLRSFISTPYVGYVAFVALALYYVNAIASLIICALAIIMAAAQILSDTGIIKRSRRNFSAYYQIIKHGDDKIVVDNGKKKKGKTTIQRKTGKLLVFSSGLPYRSVVTMSDQIKPFLNIEKAIGLFCLLLCLSLTIARLAAGQIKTTDMDLTMALLPFISAVGFYFLTHSDDKKELPQGSLSGTDLMMKLKESSFEEFGNDSVLITFAILPDGYAADEFLKLQSDFDACVYLDGFASNDNFAVTEYAKSSAARVKCALEDKGTSVKVRKGVSSDNAEYGVKKAFPHVISLGTAKSKNMKKGEPVTIDEEKLSSIVREVCAATYRA